SAVDTPSSTWAKNQRSMNGVTTPIVRLRPVTRLAALDDATYPSSAAAASTRSRVDGATCAAALSARDAVAFETPAARATSVSDAMGSSPNGGHTGTVSRSVSSRDHRAKDRPLRQSADSPSVHSGTGS